MMITGRSLDEALPRADTRPKNVHVYLHYPPPLSIDKEAQIEGACLLISLALNVVQQKTAINSIN